MAGQDQNILIEDSNDSGFPPQQKPIQIPSFRLGEGTALLLDHMVDDLDYYKSLSHIDTIYSLIYETHARLSGYELDSAAIERLQNIHALLEGINRNNMGFPVNRSIIPVKNDSPTYINPQITVYSSTDEKPVMAKVKSKVTIIYSDGNPLESDPLMVNNPSLVVSLHEVSSIVPKNEDSTIYYEIQVRMTPELAMRYDSVFALVMEQYMKHYFGNKDASTDPIISS